MRSIPTGKWRQQEFGATTHSTARTAHGTDCASDHFLLSADAAQDPSQRKVSHCGKVFSSQLVSSGSPLVEFPEACLPGGSRFCAADSNHTADINAQNYQHNPKFSGARRCPSSERRRQNARPANAARQVRPAYIIYKKYLLLLLEFIRHAYVSIFTPP